jgi:hypothetical protein
VLSCLCQALKRLCQSHAQVCQVYDTGTYDERFYIVMEVRCSMIRCKSTSKSSTQGSRSKNESSTLLVARHVRRQN